MAKKCGKCEKLVYPAEELRCLDKSWHKLCFKCWECGMQLTLKNYKGFNKLPYCNAHSPQIKATTVAHTPEQERLRKITQQNSQVTYQKEYRENLGNVTSIADDPNMQRAKQLQNLTSPRYADSRDDSSSYTRPERTGDDYEETGGNASYHQESNEGLCYKAIYDYDAAEEDEASVSSGDKIVNCEAVDEGWIIGTVERTGQRGMIPSSYVEQA